MAVFRVEKNKGYVNRGEYTDYDIPPEALMDATFAAMIQEAEKCLGYPYVWGGRNEKPAVHYGRRVVDKNLWHSN